MATDLEIQAAQENLDRWFMGQTSKHYESGNKGPATISTGKGDHGGASYGSYQLSSNMGTLNEYLKKTQNYNGEFDGLTPKTHAFDQKWVELAHDDPNFQKSQHEFIATQHYQPQLNALKNAGYDFSERGKAIQDMVWSTAVQYRNFTVSKVQRAEHESGLDFNNASDKDIITAVQDSKHKHYKADFSSSPKQWHGIEQRILNEKVDLLKLEEQENIVKGVSKNNPNPKQLNDSPKPYSQSNISDKPAVNLSDLSPTTQSLHASVSAKVQDLYAQHNQPIDQGTHNTAMQVTVALAKKGATGIERIAVKDGHIHAMQMRGEEAIIASVNTNDAANTPTDKSLSQLAAIDNTQSQMQANRTQNLNQSQSQGRSIV